MKTNRRTLIGLLLISAAVSVVLFTVSSADLPFLAPLKKIILKATPTPTITRTPTVTLTLEPTSTPTESGTPTDTPIASATVFSDTQPSATPNPFTPEPTSTVGETFTPWPSAPLCDEEIHNTAIFHTLWNSALGCHYDHEHGESPFTEDVFETFLEFDFYALLCGMEVSHCNPSSPMENTHKHGGHKWQVNVPAPQGCFIGFENAVTGVDASVVQYHAFGDYSIEFEARIHSSLFMGQLCRPGQDPGYIFTIQHQDYGQRLAPYQGDILLYPDTPLPAYASPLGPYFTIDRFGDCFGCRESLAFVRDRNINANSIWTSKGGHTAPSGSTLFNLLFRIRDNYQLLEWHDTTYPFIFGWVCGESAYNPLGCRYNNSTSTVHEVGGIIPAAWDNAPGIDTEPEVGRVSFEGFTTRFGLINPNCSGVSDECFPLKLVRAFVGKYGAELSVLKVGNPNPVDTPERDIYFCVGGIVCSETSVGALPSGWIGQNN